MSEDNIFKKLDKETDRAIDDLVRGRDEDIFIRHARKTRFNEQYGNRHVVAWAPGWFAYTNIKKDLRNPDYTKTQKIISCAIDIGLELTLDFVKVGCCYGVYLYVDRLF